MTHQVSGPRSGQGELALGHWGSKAFNIYTTVTFSNHTSLIPRGFKENQNSKARILIGVLHESPETLSNMWG